MQKGFPNQPRLTALLNRKLRLLIEQAVGEAGRINWSDKRFDQRKAYCLSLFSEIAYYKITEDERRKVGRYKVVPCRGYQAAIEHGIRIQFEDAIRGVDFEAVHVVQSKKFVAVIFLLKEMIVVAVRGTRYLYDWRINFNIRKALNSNVRFHSGFLGEARLLAFHVGEHIIQMKRLDHLLVTGHSLGGGIAATLAATETCRPALGGGWKTRHVDGCYTFASPRFTSLEGMFQVGSPYNCINDFDIVPRVPPSFLGYSNFIYEFDLTGASYSDFDISAKLAALQWTQAVIQGELLSNHSMETYRRKIRGSLR
jgi:hypothetical protein